MRLTVRRVCPQTEPMPNPHSAFAATFAIARPPRAMQLFAQAVVAVFMAQLHAVMHLLLPPHPRALRNH